MGLGLFIKSAKSLGFCSGNKKIKQKKTLASCTGGNEKFPYFRTTFSSGVVVHSKFTANKI
tara:strand:+ start:2580 stop:2762 length:183 start_codon:yes stop_codon:yes gene_type:complete